jgi:ribosomal protein S19
MKNTLYSFIKKNATVLARIAWIARRRIFMLIPKLIKRDMFVYNGKKSIYIQPEKSHLGHKLGMFAPIKKLGKEIHNFLGNRKRNNEITTPPSETFSELTEKSENIENVYFKFTKTDLYDMSENEVLAPFRGKQLKFNLKAFLDYEDVSLDVKIYFVKYILDTFIKSENLDEFLPMLEDWCFSILAEGNLSEELFDLLIDCKCTFITLKLHYKYKEKENAKHKNLVPEYLLFNLQDFLDYEDISVDMKIHVVKYILSSDEKDMLEEFLPMLEDWCLYRRAEEDISDERRLLLIDCELQFIVLKLDNKNRKSKNDYK